MSLRKRWKSWTRLLKKELLSKGSKGRSSLGGVPAVAELINSLDKKTMNSLMTRLEDKDPILTEEIRQHIFSFVDIAKIDTRGLQLILREVPNDKLLSGTQERAGRAQGEIV